MTASRKHVLVLLVAALPLLGWWTTGLFDLDEGFYGAVVTEMNRRGEWIVPYYNGVPWWEKPILVYWMAKPTVAWLGGTLGARLPSVLCALLGFCLVHWWARRRLSAAAAQIAVLVLGTTLMWVAIGRMMMTDMALCLAFNAACLVFFESLKGDRRWRIVAGALLGIGVLAKGPVAILLFVPIAGWTWWRERELRPAFRGAWFGFSIALVAVIATWYLPAYVQHRDTFVQKFLVEQNLRRFTGGDQAHTLGGIAGLVFYIPILLIAFAPWSWMLVKAWPRKGSDEASRYLAVCAAIPFLFFTASGAKLVHYILPIAVPIALLVADWLAYRWSEDGREVARRPLVMMGLACVGVAVLANVGFAWWYRASGTAEVHELARTIPEGAFVAAYQMPRRTDDRGTGRPEIQETSHPSLLFVLDRSILEAETPEDLARAPMPLYVLTRRGRVGVQARAIFRQNGLVMTRLTRPNDRYYELYRLDSKNRVSSPTATQSRGPRP